MDNKLIVVGLSGKIGTGKDFLSRKYFYPLGYKQFSLAWHFKNWVVGKRVASYEEVFHTKPPHIRHILQQTGTENGRWVYGDDIWVDTMFSWMRMFSEYWGINKYIVADVRFPNEVQAIQRNGGRVFRIVAPQRNLAAIKNPEHATHLSEVALDNYHEFDSYIKNDKEDIDKLDAVMRSLLHE